MALRIESRPVGDVLVVQCHGRIVNGSEVNALHAYFGDTRSKYSDVVMQLDKVEFIDSSGLGELVKEIDLALAFVILDENLAAQDPREAMQKLLASLGTA